MKETFYSKFIKRIMDFILSLVGLILLSPVFLTIAVMVKCQLGSPIIYKQERPGRLEKVFTLYKFRSMTDDTDSEGNLLSDEDRLTDFGRKLRSSSLDELPELMNILRGDMSIVGPRPLLIDYLSVYTMREKIRHNVRPGLTGLAQISGRNMIDWNSRLELDVKYVENISFRRDFRIIGKTILLVLKRKDVAVVTDDIEGNLAEIRNHDKRNKN